MLPKVRTAETVARRSVTVPADEKEAVERTLTSVAWAGGRIQRRCVWLNAAVEGFPTSATEDIGHNLCTLRVSSEDQFRLGASLGVRGQLGEASDDSVVGGLAREVGIESGIDQILVATAGETVAGSRHKVSLSSRVRLVVTTGQEEVYVFAGSACLGQCHGGRQKRESSDEGC